MAGGLELTLLGAPQVFWQGQAVVMQPRHLALVCYLALEGRAPRDDLTELLWGAGKSASLRTALYNMRQLPGAEHWLSDGEAVSVKAASDVAGLEQAVATGSFADTLPPLTEEHLDLLHGFKVPTPAYEEWLEERRQQVSVLLSQALWGAAQTCRNEGDLTGARTYALKLVSHDPTNEVAYRLLMRLEHQRGHPDALREAFERCATALAELGGEPSAETLKLRAELLGAEGTVAQAIRYTLGDSIPGRAPELVGRSDLLEALARALEEKPTALHGFGGVGKTALAAEVASSYLSTGDVLWLHVGRSRADDLLSAMRQALGVSGTRADDLEAALGRIALIVLDDVWNLGALTALHEVRPAGVALLATSRQRLPGFTRIPLGGLTREHAVYLLESLAERELPDAETICHVLGDHPFALRLAGTQLRDGSSPTQLLARLTDAPHILDAPGSWRDEERESIRALLTVSLDMLSDAAYHAFLAMGALGSSSVTPEFLALCTRRELEETEDALSELQGQALAERRVQPGSDVVRYLLHDLSYAFARHNTTLRARSVVAACRTLLTEHTQNFELLGAELPNIVGALETAHDTDKREDFVEMMALLVVGDAYFSARGHTPRTLKLLEKALTWAKELGQLERAHHLATKLGDAQRILYHEHGEALQAYEEGVRLARLIRNPSREAVLISLCGIARHYLGQPFEQDFERAYKIAEDAGDGLVLSIVLQHRSHVAWSEENWQSMEQFSREAVSLTAELSENPNLNQEDVDNNLFFATLNLGEAKRKLGQFEHAVELRTQALNIAITRDNQLWRAYALHELGEMYADARKSQEAEDYLRQALALYKENNAQAEVMQVEHFLLSMNAREEFTPS